MATRIGLMGLGRIGRNLFRILHDRDDLELAAISDIADPAALEYLLRFDTILGRFPGEVSIRDGFLYAAGRRIPFITVPKPGDPAANGPAAGENWADYGVDVVVEATARYRTRPELERHLERGAGRLLLCAPPKDPPDVTIVRGVNDQALLPSHRIISNGSATAHCAGPLITLLERAFGVDKLFLTSVHAYTNQQRLADVPSEDMRRGRAAAENIIPQVSNAGAMLMELLPGLAGKVHAMAVNVPIANGSLVDIVTWHPNPVDPGAINEVIRTAASAERWRGILAYEDDPIVSSDIVRSTYSSTFDALSTMVLGGRVSKTLAWFDNGWGYAHRAVELIERFAAFDTPATADSDAASPTTPTASAEAT